MRYARQEKLIGKQAQKELSKKTVTIVGLGALGTNVSSLLVRAGINLKLIDFDKIDLTINGLPQNYEPYKRKI